jgi:archaemetzincin
LLSALTGSLKLQTLVSEILIVPVGKVARETLEYIAISLPGIMCVGCRVSDSSLEPSDAYRLARKQYHSTSLLAKLSAFEAGGSNKVLGVADIDLFIPIFTFVFGEAQLGGRAALFSLQRLRQQFYGLPEDESLFYGRCEKEAAHELGHAFGLPHCPSYDCLMHFSNSIEQVDLKGSLFCSDCAASLPPG